MHEFKISEKLKKILSKLSKKDKILYEQILNKIYEIAPTGNIEHYKNLKGNMKDSKRVHIGHFVLIFQLDKNNNLIKFDDFDHHDNVYLK